MNADKETLSRRLSSAERAYRARDYVCAFQEYLKLAENGHVESQVMIGYMSQSGLGVPQNLEAARSWFERAASLGSALGNFYLGRHLSSVGDHVRALGHYKIASKLGHLPSTFRVGHSFGFGKGVPIDLDAAYKYLSTAACRGHLYAIRDLGVLDMAGGRGFFWRVLGVFEYLYAGVASVVVASHSPDSDLLRG